MLYAATVTGDIAEKRFYVSDRSTKVRFLVDSGPALSIILKQYTAKPLCRPPTGDPFRSSAPDSSTWISGYAGPFTITDIQSAIFGATALCHHGRLIALRHRHFLGGLTSLFHGLHDSPLPVMHTINAVPTSLLPDGPHSAVYSDILPKFIKASSHLEPIPDLLIHNHIVITRPLAFSQRRRLAGERLTATKRRVRIFS